MKLCIVGNRGGTNIAGSFENAAGTLDVPVRLMESCNAMQAFSLVRRFHWIVLGKRPARLHRFSAEAVHLCQRWNPSALIATGICPLNKTSLQALGRMHIKTINYLTDDPWNPAHRAPWFLDALPQYSNVYSVRRSNLSDLSKLGCPQVGYLPFGYDPSLFHPEPMPSDKETDDVDVIFAGGADRDRLPYIETLLQNKLRVALYGNYWDRYASTRGHSQGHANPEELRKALQTARVALCLVRRANRDGHAMRSFEIPAAGTCMLTEDTLEHREIFGEDGQAVIYFKNADEMLQKLRWLLTHDEERKRLARSAHLLITKGHNTYQDRLQQMLKGLP